jgi:hypothetical protein
MTRDPDELAVRSKVIGFNIRRIHGRQGKCRGNGENLKAIGKCPINKRNVNATGERSGDGTEELGIRERGA